MVFLGRTTISTVTKWMWQLTGAHTYLCETGIYFFTDKEIMKLDGGLLAGDVVKWQPQETEGLTPTDEDKRHGLKKGSVSCIKDKINK